MYRAIPLSVKLVPYLGDPLLALQSLVNCGKRPHESYNPTDKRPTQKKVESKDRPLLVVISATRDP